MDSKAELDSILADLEITRRACVSKLGWVVSGVLLLTVIGVAYFAKMRDGMSMLIVLILGVLLGLGLAQAILEKVRVAIKREVIPLLLRSVDSSLTYQAEGSLSKEEFKQAQFYSAPDRFSGKDLIEGRIGATAVRIAFVHAEDEHETTETDSDGHSKSSTEYRTTFQGLFFIADFNKHLSGKTVVTPGGVNFFSKLFGSHVSLEDPQFNKRFKVNSTDQVEARYVLTPSLMSRLQNLHDKVGVFRASFVDQRMFMAIEMRYDSLDPSVFKSLQETDQIEKMQRNLRCITDIVGDLDLNLRIWTKSLGSALIDLSVGRVIEMPEQTRTGALAEP